MDTITVTPTSAVSGSPKLTKKHSLGDIRVALGTESKVYGCEHVKDLLDNARPDVIKQYTKLVQTVRRTPDIALRLPKPGSTPSSATLKPNYLCLQCPNVASLDQRDRHEKGHRFTIESTTGSIYCRECKDYVYDPTLEDIRTQQGTKRKFTAYLSDVDSKIVAANSTPTPCRATGLRGLYNMGQTCFMSVVLQSLIHNPFIRSYYLAEGHRSTDCEKETCTSCALDDIFTEFHSTEKAEGYGMVAMLQSSWKGGGNLAGYQQQDAHEYLQFILNSLHTANIDEDVKEEKAEDCPCVVHKTFGGLLQSNVTCSKCKNVTTALDPFMDLSLDVRKEGFKKKKPDKANGAPPPKPPSMDLSECFDRFTSVETLPSSEYTCRKCSSQQTATKRLSISRFPSVLPIHLKRFSHSKSASTSIKLDTRVRFPLTIDLYPYASRPKKSKNAETNGETNGTTGDGQEKPVSSRPVYELSSVIVHKGKMDSGHYISFAKVNDEWFSFDDSKVVLVEDIEVLSSEAYMLFYVVRDIDV